MSALIRASPALMSMHNAETAWRAVASSTSRSTEPSTILRCVRLPLPASSRQRNSQTAGPLCRSARIKLPFCIDLLSVAGLLAHIWWSLFEAQSGTHCVPGPQEHAINLAEDQRGYCFAAAIARTQHEWSRQFPPQNAAPEKAGGGGSSPSLATISLLLASICRPQYNLVAPAA